MTFLYLLILALATQRITHFITDDQLPLVRAPRDWIINRNPEGLMAYWVNCTFCTSVWVAGAVTAGTDLLTDISVPMPFFFAACLSGAAVLGETFIEYLDVKMLHGGS